MIVRLPKGMLTISALKDGEFILGELQGEASVFEITAGLAEHGIKSGLQREYIEKLVAGYRGQLPIAISEIRVDLVKFNVSYLESLDTENTDLYQILAELQNKEITGMVMEGDRLLTIQSSSKRILTKPDGREIVLSDAGKEEINHLCGKNVRANEKGNTILAAIDGVAQITTRGKVSVFPFESHRSIGKVHGKIESKQALLIQGDVTGGANISSLATLIVRGVIRSSTIRCGGDLDCANGIDNIRPKDDGEIRVEQNLRTSNIKNFKVWVGAKLSAHRIIDHSDVEVLDTLICPRIADSKIAVGNQLITYNIVRDSVIKFGPGAVEDPFINKFKQTHLSRSRKHHDKHLALEFQRAHLEQLRLKSLMVLQRLKNEGQSSITLGNVLKRYLSTMEENFKIYKNGYEELLSIEQLVGQERAELAYNTSLMESFTNPKIIVVGKIEAGTRIVGPSDSIVLDKGMSSMSVVLEPESQKLVFIPLPKQGE